jgi:hypothetical protein
MTRDSYWRSIMTQASGHHDMHVFRFSVDTAVWDFWKTKSRRKIRRWEVITPMVLPRLHSEPPISSGMQSEDRQVIYWLVPKTDTDLIHRISEHSRHMRGMNRILTLAAMDHGFKPGRDHWQTDKLSSFYYPKDQDLPNYLAHHRWPKWLQSAVISGAKEVDATLYAGFDLATQKKHHIQTPPPAVLRAVLSASRRLLISPDILFYPIVEKGLENGAMPMD